MLLHKMGSNEMKEVDVEEKRKKERKRDLRKKERMASAFRDWCNGCEAENHTL